MPRKTAAPTVPNLHRTLIENGFPIEEGFTILGREVDVPGGTIDILGRDASQRLCIVELKTGRRGLHASKTTALKQLLVQGRGLNHLLQLCGYPPVPLRYIFIEVFDSMGRVKFIENSSWDTEMDLQRAI